MIRNILSRFGGQRSDGQRARVPLPPVDVLYAVGDVHGHLDLLRNLESQIAADLHAHGGTAIVVMLGDYVDRGPDSAGVLDHLSGSDGPAPRYCLCGNHEVMMLDFLAAPRLDHPWLGVGGRATLASYRLDVHHLQSAHERQPEMMERLLAEAIPSTHRSFMEAMPVAAYDPYFLFVHAGIRPGIELDQQKERDLLWIREPFLSEGPRIDRVVVHGHTKQDSMVLVNGRLGVDTGAHETGRLSALRVSQDGLYALST